ncbi:MAG: hypothetical protein ACO1O1_02580 [Adhaeribacter sp.]
MKAICWEGINKVSTERVPDPTMLNPRDAIVRVILSSVCGSDLHLLGAISRPCGRGISSAMNSWAKS